MEMGGLLQAFLSLVVAMSSTLDTRNCSDADPPEYFLIFHTSACFFMSYFALPVTCECHSCHSLDISRHKGVFSFAKNWQRHDIKQMLFIQR